MAAPRTAPGMRSAYTHNACIARSALADAPCSRPAVAGRITIPPTNGRSGSHGRISGNASNASCVARSRAAADRAADRPTARAGDRYHHGNGPRPRRGSAARRRARHRRRDAPRRHRRRARHLYHPRGHGRTSDRPRAVSRLRADGADGTGPGVGERDRELHPATRRRRPVGGGHHRDWRRTAPLRRHRDGDARHRRHCPQRCGEHAAASRRLHARGDRAGKLRTARDRREHSPARREQREPGKQPAHLRRRRACLQRTHTHQCRRAPVRLAAQRHRCRGHRPHRDRARSGRDDAVRHRGVGRRDPDLHQAGLGRGAVVAGRLHRRHQQHGARRPEVRSDRLVLQQVSRQRPDERTRGRVRGSHLPEQRLVAQQRPDLAHQPQRARRGA